MRQRFSRLPRATTQAFNLSGLPEAVCLALRTSLTGIMSLFLCGVLPRIKVQWSMRFFISMQMACSQAVQTLSSSLRTALRDCGSGRYFSTESMGFVCGLKCCQLSSWQSEWDQWWGDPHCILGNRLSSSSEGWSVVADGGLG